ncbi:hypothetical protein BSKO_03956 [Bryopsis sp. KO-2023]|nr:hypothetical protein BSKO_03956 [Bryopsis sp. KO-2023]
MSTERSSGMVDGNTPNTSARNSQPSSGKKVWLDALTDPVAGIKAYTPCIHTIDLFGDGEWRLVVGDASKVLKVWRGTHLASEHALLDTATAVTSFYSDGNSPVGKLPSMAVAAGPNIYIYRNMRPYYKFTLSLEPTPPQEQEVWNGLGNGSMSLSRAAAVLRDAQENGAFELSIRSSDFLALEDETSQEQFVEQHRNVPLIEQTVISCMTVIRREAEEPDSAGNLVLGTESGQVLILDNSSTKEETKTWIGGAPVFLAVNGLLDVEFRIFVAARDGKVYCIKERNATEGQVLVDLESQAVGMARVNKTLVVGCMNNVIHAYNFKGQKQYSLYLPSHVLALIPMEVTSQRLLKCIVVALGNGEVRVYHEKHLASVHTVSSKVSALYFGKFGREDNTLITLMKDGGLDIKILPRSANLEASSAFTGPPPEQDIPLKIPKKTKLYVEQVKREVEQAVDMHRIFQKDLCKLRLQTARAYVKVLTDGQGALSFASGSQLQLNATVQGLGPRFKVKLEITNKGSDSVQDLIALLRFDEGLYTSDRNLVKIPQLLPTLTYTYDVGIVCKDPLGGAGDVHVALVHSSSVVPLLLALVKMPVCEQEESD